MEHEKKIVPPNRHHHAWWRNFSCLCPCLEFNFCFGHSWSIHLDHLYCQPLSPPIHPSEQKPAMQYSTIIATVLTGITEKALFITSERDSRVMVWVWPRSQCYRDVGTTWLINWRKTQTPSSSTWETNNSLMMKPLKVSRYRYVCVVLLTI